MYTRIPLWTDATARLYHCARCHAQVVICRHCDRGNVYCADCSPMARVDTLKRAGKRYQSSIRGKAKHAARQRRYRDRLKQKVTHHGCARLAIGDRPQALAKKPRPFEKSQSAVRFDTISCHLCRSVCSPFLRSDFIRSG